MAKPTKQDEGSVKLTKDQEVRRRQKEPEQKPMKIGLGDLCPQLSELRDRLPAGPAHRGPSASGQNQAAAAAIAEEILASGGSVTIASPDMASAEAFLDKVSEAREYREPRRKRRKRRQKASS